MSTKDKVREVIDELVNYDGQYEVGEMWKPVMNTRFIDTAVSKLMTIIQNERSKARYGAEEMARKMENYKL